MASSVTCEPKEVAFDVGMIEFREKWRKMEVGRVFRGWHRCRQCFLNLFGRKGGEGFKAEIECPGEKMLFVKKWREMKAIDEREESEKR
ncbi:hypothetical protein VNO80_00456 [Phaseolus coccineus]|uniref:Uncharacterized protein n=1 Tax=Phaseolus coccineus TaxID=3886 RepID=A0AAN9P2T0_PHACN